MDTKQPCRHILVVSHPPSRKVINEMSEERIFDKEESVTFMNLVIPLSFSRIRPVLDLDEEE